MEAQGARAVMRHPCRAAAPDKQTRRRGAGIAPSGLECARLRELALCTRPVSIVVSRIGDQELIIDSPGSCASRGLSSIATCRFSASDLSDQIWTLRFHSPQAMCSPFVSFADPACAAYPEGLLDTQENRGTSSTMDPQVSFAVHRSDDHRADRTITPLKVSELFEISRVCGAAMMRVVWGRSDRF